MAESKEVLLNRETIIRILGYPKFYEACLPFFLLRESGLEAWGRYLDSKKDKSSKTCGGCGTSVDNVVGVFLSGLGALQTVAPEELRKVYEFVSGLMGFKPAKMLVYVRRREDGGTYTIDLADPEKAPQPLSASKSLTESKEVSSDGLRDASGRNDADPPGDGPSGS
jgi:hypothetical protein